MVPPATLPGMNLNALDAKLAELKARFPGWRIWYVPTVVNGVTWCAQPLPLINSSSPDSLAREIEAATPGLAVRDSDGLDG